MSKFLSPRFADMEPYVPGEQPQDKKYIKLNTNESPFLPSPKVIEKVNSAQVCDLNLYSDPTANSLVEAIAENYGVNKDMVIVSNGSDEMLAFAFMAFCGSDKGVCFADHTYGFYSVFADLFKLDAKIIPLREDFSIAPEDYYNIGRTVFIANPNAPTGMMLTSVQIEDILKQNRNDLVVIDEAYVDFGGESVVKLVNKYDNLLVVGTFSKSRNLAGARIGYAVSNRDIISDINKMKYSFNPYNVNRLSIVAGTQAMKDKKYFNECCTKIIENRAYTTDALRNLGFEVLDSKANFVFAKCPCMDGDDYYKKLKDNGILVRHFNKPRIENYVRITIGTYEQMQTLAQVTKEIMEESR